MQDHCAKSDCGERHELNQLTLMAFAFSTKASSFARCSSVLMVLVQTSNTAREDRHADVVETGPRSSIKALMVAVEADT